MKMKLLLFVSMLIGSVSLSILGSPATYAQPTQANYVNSTVLLANTIELDPAEEKPASSCAVEGIGWIVCPVVRTMAMLVDGAYMFVSSLLVVQPLLSTGSGPNVSVYNTWTMMRNVANVAFVIAFLIIIFSQLTSVGLNNYGIKKMLPRLIVAAILVNVSFWICAIAVDVSNILGSSLNSVMQGAATTNGCSLSPTGSENCLSITMDKDNPDTTTGVGWAGIAGFIIAGTGIAGVALYATLSALLPALLAAIVAIVTVFLVLTLRQALIILLVIISPLAFVAYLLPNTEQLFKKWMALFKTLLLMYPIIAMIFGASALASTIVMNTAPEGDYKVAIQVMGALISIIPLALTPIVMKTAGGLLNRFGGIINNPNKGPVDKLRRKAEGYRDYRQAMAKGRRIKRASDFRAGKTFNGKIGSKVFGAAGSDDRKLASRAFGGAYEANQRDRSRKDKLSAFESEAEQTYNESAAGQQYATAAIQAKNRAGTASTNIAALAAETTAKADLSAEQSAKDRQNIADTNNQAFAESNRDLGTRLEQALAKSQSDKAQEQNKAQVEAMLADDSKVPAPLSPLVQSINDATRATGIAKSQTEAAQRVDTANFNQAVVNDANLQAALGGIDPLGAQRALANAKFKIEQAEMEELKMERPEVSEKNKVELKSIIADANSSPAKVSAALERLVRIGDVEEIEQEVNRFASDGKATLINKTLAAALQNDGPGFLKASDIDNIARGQMGKTEPAIDQSTGQPILNADGSAKMNQIAPATLRDMAQANIRDGVFSQEKMVAASNNQINYAYSIADDKGKQTLVNTANQLLDNEVLKGKIKHNIDTITTVAKSGTPTTRGASTNQQAGTLNIDHVAPNASPANARTSAPSNINTGYRQSGGLYVPNNYQPQSPPQQPPSGPNPPNTP